MGAISGRNFVARYPNGDTAKLYTNVFLLNDWLSEDNNVDETEIDAKKWVSPQTIDHMHLTFSGQAVYRIYRQYKKTNSVQVLTLNSELQRFIDAQNGEIVGVSSYEDAVIELENGQKKTHWMWFVVPQLSGLGRSERAIYYGIHDQKEAYAYLNDAILKKRLEKIITITLTLETNDPVLVFGAVDAEKFQASLTLFSQISSSMLYKQALDKYFNGQKHVKTLALLQ